MNQALLDKIESEQFRKNPVDFNVGDSVRVHTRVVEGNKERIQVFAGVVIGRRGRGMSEDVERQGAVRRAKLTYLRKRIGKSATLVKQKVERKSAKA